VVHACAAHATADSRSTRRETGIMAQQAASSSQPGAAAAAAARARRRGAARPAPASHHTRRSLVAARGGLGYEAAGGLALQNSPADSDRSQPAVSSHAESWFRTSYSRGRNPK
jgi:hypothetical protein